MKYTAPFYDYALQPLATWRAGRTRCHIAFRVPRAGFVGQGRAVLRHQNARCLKSAPRRKTHTWLHQCLGTQAEADAIHCNLLFFFFLMDPGGKFILLTFTKRGQTGWKLWVGPLACKSRFGKPSLNAKFWVLYSVFPRSSSILPHIPCSFPATAEQSTLENVWFFRNHQNSQCQMPKSRLVSAVPLSRREENREESKLRMIGENFAW